MKVFHTGRGASGSGQRKHMEHRDTPSYDFSVLGNNMRMGSLDDLDVTKDYNPIIIEIAYVPIPKLSIVPNGKNQNLNMHIYLLRLASCTSCKRHHVANSMRVIFFR